MHNVLSGWANWTSCLPFESFVFIKISAKINQASLTARMWQRIRHWLPLCWLRLYNLCLKDGEVVLSYLLCLKSTQTYPTGTPNPTTSWVRLWETLISCFKVFPDLSYSEKKYSLVVIFFCTRPCLRALSIFRVMDFLFFYAKNGIWRVFYPERGFLA